MIFKVALILISIVGGEPKGSTIGAMSSFEECAKVAQQAANELTEGNTVVYAYCIKYPVKGNDA